MVLSGTYWERDVVVALMNQHIRQAMRSMAPAARQPYASLDRASAPVPLPVTATPISSAPQGAAIESAALLQEWDELARRSRAALYLSPAWIQAWWRAFGTGRMDILTLRRGGRLVGLLPMTWNQGVLESAANYHTPAFELLAEDSEAALTLARDVFAKRPPHLCITSLDPAEGTLIACQRAAEEAGYKVLIRDYQRSPYLDLVGSWNEYESGLGRNLLRNLRRARRHLEPEGALTVEIFRGDRGFGKLLHEAFAVEASGWKGAGRTAIESDPRTRAFYTDIARWGASRGMLHLYFLRLGRRPLAMYFALVHRGTCHLLKGGFDPAYRRYSPGNLLMHTVIRDCFTAGLTRIEFNGDAEAYKFCWAAAVRERKRLEAFAPNFSGRLAWAGFTFVRPVARRLLHALGIRPEGDV